MKKNVPVNKFLLIGALVLGGAGTLIGIISDYRIPCENVVETFVSSSEQIHSRVGKVSSLTLRKRTSVNASSDEAAYILYYYFVRGEVATASVVLKADPANCSCVVESIDKI